MNVNSFVTHGVTPMDFYRLGAGMLVDPMQVEEAQTPPMGSPPENLPPPPPTPVCVEAVECPPHVQAALAQAREELKDPKVHAAAVSMAAEVQKALKEDKEYKKKCIARAKDARAAVAAAHIVGATPARIMEETEEQVEELAEDLTEMKTVDQSDEGAKAGRPKLDLSQFPEGAAVLCWDTETAGLGKPAICQLAYILVDRNRDVQTYDKIWKLPSGIFMNKDAQKIHGISMEQCKAGADATDELLKFWKLAQQVIDDGGVVLGHNIAFDVRAFNFTCEQWGLPNSLEHKHMIDTMKLSKPYSPLKTSNNRQKAFKNEELCELAESNMCSNPFADTRKLCCCADKHLWGRYPAWARLHSAMDDVHVTILNYRRGREEGWW